VKAKIFIASSGENLDLAHAVEENLHRDFETRVWDEDVFRLSQYPLDELAEQLRNSDFGIFIMHPTDIAVIRGEKEPIPRDNVIFELGLFMGQLGRNRTFLIVPHPCPDLHLPSDLKGLIVGDYEIERRDKSTIAALAPVCSKIRRLVNERSLKILKQRIGLLQVGLFPDFVSEFDKILRVSRDIVLYFIHSRRWRENHDDSIRHFLDKPNTLLTVILPNLGNRSLIHSLMGHFDDGPSIPGFIADAYRYFRNLSSKHAGKVTILLFNVYPTYTFYKFDETVIIAMYPTTTIKKPVPTFKINIDGAFGDFLAKDIDQLVKACKRPTMKHLTRLEKRAATYADDNPQDKPVFKTPTTQ